MLPIVFLGVAAQTGHAYTDQYNIEFTKLINYRTKFLAELDNLIEILPRDNKSLETCLVDLSGYSAKEDSRKSVLRYKNTTEDLTSSLISSIQVSSDNLRTNINDYDNIISGIKKGHFLGDCSSEAAIAGHRATLESFCSSGTIYKLVLKAIPKLPSQSPSNCARLRIGDDPSCTTLGHSACSLFKWIR